MWSLEMLEGSLGMSFPSTNSWPICTDKVNKIRTRCRTRANHSEGIKLLSVLAPTDAGGNPSEARNFSGSSSAPRRHTLPNPLLGRGDAVGIIGGSSVLSTLVFLEKLVLWSSKGGEKSVPFVVCSDPALNKHLSLCSPFHSSRGRNVRTELNEEAAVENLRRKRAFLEDAGAGCVVMPCHLCHVWHEEVSKGCDLPFLHVAECLARELKRANLKPLEAGSDVRIGLLGTNAVLMSGFYQEQLQRQGFEVVLPDKATMDHIYIPAVEALHRKDIEGAQNLLRVAIQVLLIRAANTVVLASDELQGLLPRDDPLWKKSIDPMDALARSAVEWAKSKGKKRHNQGEA
ncbi:broad specificity amino-acid racemase RacX-like isoform X2 [Rhodamnia argentea]|uniref:Broad specificity amino-acid racemase RacX-like isoform X2 n=1 Tax=Rhodamnia argentea TaxID=178133 RepID=A0A8B8QSM8_9MYRT|nr:broad specificity amino-acid racemase RacX-like isoform X2 [Rhodamnia argentea]